MFNVKEKTTSKITFGTIVNDDINLRKIPNFLSPEECDHLINLSKDNMNISMVISEEKNDQISNERTSYSYFLKKDKQR